MPEAKHCSQSSRPTESPPALSLTGGRILFLLLPFLLLLLLLLLALLVASHGHNVLALDHGVSAVRLGLLPPRPRGPDLHRAAQHQVALRVERLERAHEDAAVGQDH